MDRTSATLLAFLVIGPAFRVTAQEGTSGLSDQATAAGDESTVTVVAEGTSASRLIRRDPFWPVGFEPAPPQVHTVTSETGEEIRPKESEVSVEWPTLQLKGITRLGSGKYVGLLSGLGVVEEGDIIKCTKKGIVYRWEITGVGPDGVVHRRLEAVPLEESRKTPAP